MGGRGGVKYNRYFSRGGKGGRGGGGGRQRWEGHRADEDGVKVPRDNRDQFSVHLGSFKLEDVMKSPDWERRITQPENSPKRKYALCIGYIGTRYQGLQINPGAKTVEAVLEKALFLAGAIHEKNFGNIQKVQWSRTARTDKGVHAISQCCSMKLSIPLGQEDEFRHVVNTFLPADIVVHHVQKVTKS